MIKLSLSNSHECFFFFELSGDMYGMGENIKQTKNDQIESKSN